MTENLILKKIMLTWDEIMVQNKKMSTAALIRLMKDANVFSNIMNIERFEDIIVKMVPPISSRESEFYQRGYIS